MRIVVFSLVCGLVACGTPTEPKEPPEVLDPGTLSVQLTSTTSLGALVLEVSPGTAVERVTGSAGIGLWSKQNGGVVRIILAGTVVSGEIFQIESLDRRTLPRVAIIDASGSGEDGWAILDPSVVSIQLHKR